MKYISESKRCNALPHFIKQLLLFLFISCSNCIVYSQKPDLVLPIGHTARVNCVCFSPDGRYALSGSYGTIILWDIRTGKEIKSFEGHTNWVLSVCFTPDSKYFLSGSSDKTIKVWDIQSGKVLKTIERQNSNVESVCFSANGLYALVGLWDHALILYDIQRACEIKSFIGHTEEIKAVCFSPDGRYALSGSGDNKMKLWDIQSGKEIRSFEGHIYSVNSVCFSPDGKSALSGSYDNTLKLWDIQTGQEIKSFVGHRSSVNSVYFSSDSKYALSGSDDQILKLWDIQSGKEIKAFIGHNDIIRSVCFSPDSRYALTGSDDCKVKLWDIQKAKELRSFQGYSTSVSSVCFSPDGRYALSGAGDNTLKLWDIQNGKEIKSLTGHSNLVTSVCFSSDGKRALSGSFDRTLKLWDIQSGRVIKSMDEHTDIVNSVCLSTDDKYALSGSSDHTLILWDIESGKEIKSFLGHIFAVNSVCFSPDGCYVLSGSTDGTIKLWGIESGKEIKSFLGHIYAVNSVCFSPDGFFALSGSADKSLKLWDIRTGKEIKSFLGHTNWINSVCFSPNGKYILSASSDKSIKLWDIQSGNEVRSYKGRPESVLSVCFSPDGKYALSGSWGTTVDLWNIQDTNETATFISIDTSDFVTITNDNYYLCSKQANLKLGWRIGLNVFGFDQFDLQYNRPDIVIGNIDYAPKELINSYSNAYYKRIKKMKFDESMFSPDFHTPEIEITNVKEFDFYTEKGILPVKIFAADNKYNLDRINLSINNIPIYGINGISLRGQNKDSVLMEIPLQLSHGNNKVQVSCLNEKGVESLKESFEIRYEPENPGKTDLYFVGIGVSEYTDTRLNLNYAAKDIRDLSALFKEKYPGIVIDTLLNKVVTRENVLDLKKQLLKTNVDDQVILSISGHGFLSDSLNFYYGTSDIDCKHPEIKGLSYDDIEWLLDSIPARKKLVMMDACHSGEVDKDILEGSGPVQLAENISTKSAKGAEMIFDSTSIGLQNSFELMQELFANLSKGNGAVVISAAGGLEYAYEGSDWKNGVFTYCVRKGLEDMQADANGDKTISVNELKDYLYLQVGKLTNGKQKPTSRSENLENDWKVW